VDNTEPGAGGRSRSAGDAGRGNSRRAQAPVRGDALRWPRKRTWQVSALIAVIIVVASVAYGRAVLSARVGGLSLTMLVPAYVFPGQPPLVRLETLSPPPGIVILNPDNGDGPFNAQWQSQADLLRGRGISVFGYVHTDNATRPLAATEASISNYFQSATGPSPHVSGIFLDEMSPSCATEPYYATLYSYIHGIDPLAVVVANPGVPVNVCFLRPRSVVANMFVTFEHDVTTYIDDYQGNVVDVNGTITSGRRYPAGYFCHLIYGASRAQMRHVLALAAARHAGCVYVTDSDLPNPWDTVATYLAAEARAIAGLPAADRSR
jgi:Spherulation-specific family 4